MGHEGWSERGKERKERATVTVCTLAFQSHEDESDMGREGGAAQGDSRCKGSKGPRATHEDEGEREGYKQKGEIILKNSNKRMQRVSVSKAVSCHLEDANM